MTNENSALFAPIKLGAIELNNRFVMAPLTRCRAVNDHLPNELMAEYYAQRASAGLIITECNMVTPGTSTFAYEPGIYSEAQTEAWKKVTKAVHDAGGKIVMQIWHAGRAALSGLNNNSETVSASTVAIAGESTTPKGKFPYTPPRELSKNEIQDIIQEFRKGAENAKEAGFDGIEIHGANGYLIDQFLRDGSNQRTDEYGGSFENRARFLTEVIDAVTAVWGEDRVGLRLSPLNSYNDMKDSDPVALISYLSERLNQYDLAYLHVMRADFFGQQQADVISPAAKIYQGNLMVNMGYSPEEAAQTIAANTAQVVAFGTGFLANPDLPARVKQGATLNSPDQNTFYSQGAEGYTDYPTL